MNNSSPSSLPRVDVRIGTLVYSFPPETRIVGWFEPAEPVRRFLRALVLSYVFTMLVSIVTLALLSSQQGPLGITGLLMVASSGALAGFAGGAATALYDDWSKAHRRRWLPKAAYGASLRSLVLGTWRS